MDFSVDETREKVARDMKEVDSVLKRDAHGLTEELYLRFGLICDYMSDTLCDYSLCSLDADKESVRKCVTVIVQDCYNVLRGEFDEYLGSPDAFKRTPGQETKIMLLQLIVTQNDRFRELVQDHMYYLGYKMISPLSLLPQKYSPTEVIEWYCSLPGVRNTDLARKGLRTGQQFQSQQEQPTMDYEEIGGQIMASSLPETVLMQLSIYLEAVITTGKRFVMTFDKEEEVWSQGERGK